MLDLVRHFKLDGPLLLAPMAGGPGTPELTAAVCNAGGLGSIGGAYLSPELLEEEIQKTRRLTLRPFVVNLFVPTSDPAISSEQLARAREATNGYRKELGIADLDLQPPYSINFEKQVDVIFKLRPAALSFVFGLLKPELIQQLKHEGILTVGTATTLDEAFLLQGTGVDAIVAQGVEAGGHRGIFDSRQSDPGIGVFDLTSACVAKLKIPVIAAGGIMNAQGIAKALRAGAQAAQLGTAFLACKEAGTSKPYLESLFERPVRKTRLTRAFSGRLARGLENRFLVEMENRGASVLPFPAQNAFTRDLRAASVKQGSADFLSLWAGEGFREIESTSASDLTMRIFKDLLLLWRE